jgi:ribonuclease J
MFTKVKYVVNKYKQSAHILRWIGDENLTSIKFYGGVDEIGGNRILVEDKDTRIFLDFGMSFSRHGMFFEEYLKPRYSCAGMKDLLELKLLHYMDGLYREDLLCLVGKKPHSEPYIDEVLLSHIHQDHSAYVSLLDERIPISCSEISLSYAKAVLEAGRRSLETEVYNFKKRPLIDKKCPATPRVFNVRETEKPFKIDSIEVKPFAVDHSVPGAMAFVIHTSDQTLAYTGDLRLHGIRGNLTQKFIDEAANEDIDIMLCEGTRIDEKESGSEKLVAESAHNVISKCDHLVVTDFAYKDLDRFMTFYSLAKRNDRKIVISKRHAYLLEELQNVPALKGSIPEISDENIFIYIDRKDTGRFEESDYDGWEQKFLGMANAVKADWIHENQAEALFCLSFFDVNELIDIAPNAGSIYVHSTSEPHNEEQIFDEQRLNNWLDFFGLKKHHFHCSGHADGKEIREMIQTINPKELIPIHTQQPELFEKIHKNVQRPKLEEF